MVRGSEVRPHRHPDGTNRARSERMSKDCSLAPVEPAGDPAAAEIQERGYGHKSAMGTGYQDARVAETGYRTGQRTLLGRGMPEDTDEERRPPKQQHALNLCGHVGGEGVGVPLTQQRTHTVRSQGMERDSQTWQRLLLACGQGEEEEGGPPTQQRAQPVRGQGREGAIPNRQRTTLAHSQGTEEGGNPPPNISVRTLCTACSRGRGGGP